MKVIVDLGIRYGLLALVILLTLAVGFNSLTYPEWRIYLLILIPLTLVGLWDLMQSRHNLLRNYPLVAHIRWMFETSRPYLRQYIVESDLSERPFTRKQRSLIYERAKNTVDSQPFGTDLDLYDTQYELLTHSINAQKVANTDFRIRVGGPQCSRPYDVSLLNISAMSFGALSGRAIEALNKGAASGGFYHDTGEGGISTYHRRYGGDLVWEIGTGYFGCRDQAGQFDLGLFTKHAQHKQVKMIEIKLSQGAKPGHGGVLPGIKVTEEIAFARHVPAGVACVSPPAHSAFRTPVELLEFVALLRTHAGGKPVGIKLCIGHPWELFAICKAMLKTDILLDFIVVDGAEGGTGAAPEELSDHLGMTLREGLILTRNALVGTGLRNHVSLGASGKVCSAFSIASNLALGADWCNAGRAFMFSLGCVMSKKCHTDKCPTGITTQDTKRQHGLVVADKAIRVANFHRNTLARLGELIGAVGLAHPSELRPHHLHHRTGPNAIATMDKIIEFLPYRALLDAPESTPYKEWWAAATPDSFQPRQDTGPGQYRR